MSKNLIPQIAQMLGVELNEEFKIKGCEGVVYKFIVDGLLVSDDDAEKVYTTVNMPLVSLIKGDIEIIKLPWKPKKGDIYYSFNLVYGTWVVCQHVLTGSPFDYALLDKGWVFRTCEEAQAALPAVAKELGVEYKL